MDHLTAESMMEALFTSGLIADLILLVMLLEGIVLSIYHRKTGRGPASHDVISNLLAGASLVLAFRAALVGAGWQWIALALSVALLTHLLDLRRRWRT